MRDIVIDLLKRFVIIFLKVLVIGFLFYTLGWYQHDALSVYVYCGNGTLVPFGGL